MPEGITNASYDLFVKTAQSGAPDSEIIAAGDKHSTPVALDGSRPRIWKWLRLDSTARNYLKSGVGGPEVSARQSKAITAWRQALNQRYGTVRGELAFHAVQADVGALTAQKVSLAESLSKVRLVSSNKPSLARRILQALGLAKSPRQVNQQRHVSFARQYDDGKALQRLAQRHGVTLSSASMSKDFALMFADTLAMNIAKASGFHRHALDISQLDDILQQTFASHHGVASNYDDVAFHEKNMLPKVYALMDALSTQPADSPKVQQLVDNLACEAYKAGVARARAFKGHWTRGSYTDSLNLAFYRAVSQPRASRPLDSAKLRLIGQALTRGNNDIRFLATALRNRGIAGVTETVASNRNFDRVAGMLLPSLTRMVMDYVAPNAGEESARLMASSHDSARVEAMGAAWSQKINARRCEVLQQHTRQIPAIFNDEVQSCLQSNRPPKILSSGTRPLSEAMVKDYFETVGDVTDKLASKAYDAGPKGAVADAMIKDLNRSSIVLNTEGDGQGDGAVRLRGSFSDGAVSARQTLLSFAGGDTSVAQDISNLLSQETVKPLLGAFVFSPLAQNNSGDVLVFPETQVDGVDKSHIDVTPLGQGRYRFNVVANLFTSNVISMGETGANERLACNGQESCLRLQASLIYDASQRSQGWKASLALDESNPATFSLQLSPDYESTPEAE